MKSLKIILPVVAAAVLGGMVFKASTVKAQTNSNFFSGLVTAIAQKFGLKETEVQSVVANYHTSKRQAKLAEIRKQQEAYLDGLVSQGKITTAQKQAIIAEFSKLKTKYDTQALGNLTFSERKNEMQKRVNELNDWAKSQGIDPSLLRAGWSKQAGWGAKHRGGMWWSIVQVTPTPGK